MEPPSVRVRFKATGERQSWRHRVAAIETIPYGKTTTTRVRAPVVLQDGDVAEMTAWEARWVVQHYPMNFFPVGAGSDDPADAMFNVDACTYAQLQNAARKLGIRLHGKEAELRESVRAAIAQKTESKNEVDE